MWPNEAWTSGFGCPNKRKRRYMDWTLFALLWVAFVEAFADVELLLNFLHCEVCTLCEVACCFYVETVACFTLARF